MTFVGLLDDRDFGSVIQFHYSPSGAYGFDMFVAKVASQDDWDCESFNDIEANNFLSVCQCDH
jgi:hypothetical protein